MERVTSKRLSRKRQMAGEQGMRQYSKGLMRGISKMEHGIFANKSLRKQPIILAGHFEGMDSLG